MDELMIIAGRRPLTLEDTGLVAAGAEQVQKFCDSFALRLARLYLADDLSWGDADVVANNYYELMILHCGNTMPAYAWDIFLAFDEGEIDGRGDAFTRQRILALHSEYGVA